MTTTIMTDRPKMSTAKYLAKNSNTLPCNTRSATLFFLLALLPLAGATATGPSPPSPPPPSPPPLPLGATDFDATLRRHLASRRRLSGGTGQFTNAVRVAAGSDTENGFTVVSDGAGGYYVCGIFRSSSITIGSTTLIRRGTQDGFIARLDSSGAAQCAVSVGGSSQTTRAEDLGADGSGNALVVGWSQVSTLVAGTITLNKGNSNRAAWVGKVDASCNFIWAVLPCESSNTNTYAYQIEADGVGGSYVTGSFSTNSLVCAAYTLSLVHSSTSYSNWYLLRLNSVGTIQNAVTSSGGRNSVGSGMSVDSTTGDVYTTGYYKLGSNFRFGGQAALSTTGNWDGFVVKHSQAGVAQWSVRYGGSSDDVGRAVAYDVAAGGAYAAGYFSGSATYGSTTLTSSGGEDGFVMRISNLGAIQWAIKVGGSGNDRTVGVAYDTVTGGVIVTGRFQSTATFGTYGLVTSDIKCPMDPSIRLWRVLSVASAEECSLLCVGNCTHFSWASSGTYAGVCMGCAAPTQGWVGQRRTLVSGSTRCAPSR